MGTMANIGVKERRMGSVTILDADKNLRFALKFGGSKVTLLKAVEASLEEGRSQIILNLNGVFSVDASFVGQMVSAQVIVVEKGGQLKLVHLNQRIQQLISSARLEGVFEIYDDELMALDSFEHDKVPESAMRK